MLGWPLFPYQQWEPFANCIFEPETSAENIENLFVIVAKKQININGGG